MSVDIDGVAGVTGWRHGRAGNPEYERARRLMTHEANAAIRGAFAGGATVVDVTDSHGPMRNLIAEDLDERAMLIQGRPRPLSMAQGLTGQHDALILIGWHAAAGSFGTLAHTVNNRAFAAVRLNGRLVGEAGLFAGYAASLGVPLIAASGEDRLAEEVACLAPGARVIEVKRHIAAQSARSLSPAAARAAIESGVGESLAAMDRGTRASAIFDAPFALEIDMRDQLYADAACLMPGVHRAGSERVAFESADFEEILHVVNAASIMAGAMFADHLAPGA
ncbi:MAG: M55 family metallopeptidase [Erythrobacter sp.]|nr:M55 family metallopeptidase [Erythrobacter sp.]